MAGFHVKLRVLGISHVGYWELSNVLAKNFICHPQGEYISWSILIGNVGQEVEGVLDVMELIVGAEVLAAIQ